MPTFDIQLPDGRIASIEAPEGATEQQAIEFARQQFAQQQPAAPAAPVPFGTGAEAAESVEVPQLGQVVFPAGTPEPEKQRIIAARLAEKGITPQTEARRQALEQQAAETGLGEAALVSVGKGLVDVGRGATKLAAGAFGADETVEQIRRKEAEEAELFEPLQKARPVTTFVGELLGEVAPFAPAGLLAAGGKTLAGRAVGQALVGAAEGAVLAEEPEEGAAIGAGFGVASELLAPRIARTFRRITGKLLKQAPLDKTGELTPAFADLLRKEGIDPSQISDGVKRSLIEQLDPDLDDVAKFRQARAEEFGFDLSGAQATRSFPAQEAEQTVLTLATPEGEVARGLQAGRVEQAAVGAREKLLRPLKSSIDLDFENKASTFSKRELGGVIKGAADELKTRDQGVIGELYRVARELPGDKLPLDGEALRETFFSAIDEIEPDERALKSIKKTMAKFGIIGDNPQKVGTSTVVDFEGESIKFLGDVEPFDINNSESIRQRLNKAFQADNTGIIGVLKRQIDNNVGEIVEDAINKAPTEKAEAFVGARNAFSKFKADFEAGDIIQDLASFKRGTSTPKIAEEEVFNKIFRSSRKIDNIKRIKKTLLTKPTKQSRQAWTDLGAVAVEDLLGQAVNPQTGALSGARLNTAINKFGDDTLKELLPIEQFKRLKSFQGALADLTIPLSGTTNPSGTGGRVLNMALRLMDFKAPGIGTVIKRRGEKAATREAIKAGLASIKGLTPTGSLRKRIDISTKALLSLGGTAKAVEKVEPERNEPEVNNPEENNPEMTNPGRKSKQLMLEA